MGPELAYGDCFLRYPYERELLLVNASDELSAHYKVAPQEPQTKVVADYVGSTRGVWGGFPCQPPRPNLEGPWVWSPPG